MDKNFIKDKADSLKDKHLSGAKDKKNPWWLRLLYLAGAIIIAGSSALFMQSCTGVDHMILQGEKGTLNYYVDPASGDSVLIVSPAKVQPKK